MCITLKVTSLKIFKDSKPFLKEKNCQVDVYVEENESDVIVLKVTPTVSASVTGEYQFNTIKNLLKIKKIGSLHLHVQNSIQEVLFKLTSTQDQNSLYDIFDQFQSENEKKQAISLFDQRTDPLSEQQYFQFYSYLYQQQNMLADRIRTETYQFAILKNPSDFKDKVVLDVGAGTGVLSFFAVHSGAKKVYAIEASSMAVYMQKLVDSNNLSDKIIVINKKVEDIDSLPLIDTIVSEPLGYMLFNERMIETFIHARKFLAPTGNLYPNSAELFFVPFTDESLYWEIFSKASFWTQESFYGFNLSSLHKDAFHEYFSQPIIDNFDSKIFISQPSSENFNFMTLEELDLKLLKIPLEFEISTSCVMHGIAFWFNANFHGSDVHLSLSTAPGREATHWYQVRLLLPVPIRVCVSSVITGYIQMVANNKQSYDITLHVEVKDYPEVFSSGKYDLKNCFFRFFSAVGHTNANISGAIQVDKSQSSKSNSDSK